MNVGCRSPCLWCATLVAWLSFVGASARGSEHDEVIVRLRSGESLKGRLIVERCDEKVFVVQDHLSGAVRALSWTLLEPEDRERLDPRASRHGPLVRPVEGDRLTLRLLDGSRVEVYGRIVEEDDERVVLWRDGKTIGIRKERIERRSRSEMDPRDIWSPAQLVARFLRDLVEDEGADPANLTAEQHFRLAEYARAAEDHEAAREHYAACARDPTFPGAKVATQRLDEVRALLRDRDALATLREARRALALKAFRAARELITGFTDEHPQVSASVRRRLEKAKEEFESRRSAFYRIEIRIHLPKVLRRLIDETVRDQDATLKAAVAWTRRELPETLFETTAARFEKWDDVTPEEARAFWQDRPRGTWHTASYGSGTFIVDPPKVRAGAEGRRRDPEAWWRAASAKERASWLTAWFAEKSELFELSDRMAYTPCSRCSGTGLTHARRADGRAVEVLCARCLGARRDRAVRYR